MCGCVCTRASVVGACLSLCRSSPWFARFLVPLIEWFHGFRRFSGILSRGFMMCVLEFWLSLLGIQFFLFQLVLAGFLVWLFVGSG